MSAPVMRIGPMRFVVMVETSIASSTAPDALSTCMTPALLMSTFNFGYSSISFFATAAMLAGFSASNSMDFIPGLAFVVSAKWPLRRPEMIIWLPSRCSASASPRPIPEPPPVTKIVLPVSFICFPLFLLVVIVSDCTSGPLALAGQFAAIDSDGRTRDEGGLVGSDKHNGLGNLFGQTYSFKRDSRNQCRLLLLTPGEP